MAQVSMDLVKKLRKKTHVGYMDCKKALEEAEGDLEKAVDLLRKKGAAVAAKRAEHATDNGRIEAYVSDDFKSGSLIEIACETDFSANTDDMKQFALKTAELSTQTHVEDGKKLLEDNQALNNVYNELLAKISEKIEISKIAHFSVEEHGIVNHYIHPGSTVGVMIELATEHEASNHIDKLKSIARDICMHIAVMNPPYLNLESIDKDALDKEREIIKEQLLKSGKPENIIDKIMVGKLNKYYQENCLVRQKYIRNEDLSIEQYVKELSDKIKNKISIKRFARYSIGR